MIWPISEQHIHVLEPIVGNKSRNCFLIRMTQHKKKKAIPLYQLFLAYHQIFAKLFFVVAVLKAGHSKSSVMIKDDPFPNINSHTFHIGKIYRKHIKKRLKLLTLYLHWRWETSREKKEILVTSIFSSSINAFEKKKFSWGS